MSEKEKIKAYYATDLIKRVEILIRKLAYG